MSVAITIGFTGPSLAIIDQWRSTPDRLVPALDAGLTQWLQEIESHTKANLLSGKAGAGAGGKSPVGLRSGALRQAVVGQRDGELSGFVGTTTGTTTPYARAILGPGETVITPQRAKNLWVPIADNLGPSKLARMTPGDMFSRYSKENVVYLKGPRGETYVFAREGEYKRGARKGQMKGKLLFVLRKRVVIVGSDALAIGAKGMLSRGSEILTQHLQSAFPGGGQ